MLNFQEDIKLYNNINQFIDDIKDNTYGCVERGVRSGFEWNTEITDERYSSRKDRTLLLVEICVLVGNLNALEEMIVSEGALFSDELDLHFLAELALKEERYEILQYLAGLLANRDEE